MLTLHVTNGDVSAQGLARSGLPGDVLVWRDVLHDGPVPSDGQLAPFRAAVSYTHLTLPTNREV